MTNHHNAPACSCTRRRFMEMVGLAGAGVVASQCAPAPRGKAIEPVTSTPTAVPTATQTAAPTATSTPIPSPTPIPPTLTPTQAFKATVGIQKAASYEPALVRQSLQTLLDSIGGLGDIVKPGARVAIKVNLTGGAVWAGANSLPPTEVFMTHPEVVKALCELLRDAGARKIYIVEGIVEPESYPVLGTPRRLKRSTQSWWT